MLLSIRFTKIQLGIMMFLQFFVWGGWFVTLGTYLSSNLSASGGEIGSAFATQSWGAILAPLLVGIVADRYFNAERILAVLHIVGAGLMYMLYLSNSFDEFYPVVLAYMILYMPTLALVNSISFRHLQDPAIEFSRTRLWGTIGWIISGLLISYVFAWDTQEGVASGALRNTFLVCSAAAALLGMFSLTLPKTPPKSETSASPGLSGYFGRDALGLLKDKNFAVFFVSSVLICIPLAFYYQNASPFLTSIDVQNATAKLTIGQVSEVFFMLLLPLFIARFGIKVTLLLGMLAWVVRYSLFAVGAEGNSAVMLIAGIALHGICYDFFFVCGQIHTDKAADESFRSSAQGLITLATYGVGMLIGFHVAGLITDYYTLSGTIDWRSVWRVPAVLAVTVMSLFLVFFRTEPQARNERPHL